MANLIDGDGKLWDIINGALVHDGTNDAFDMGYSVGDYGASQVTTEENGRELVFFTQVIESGIEMARKVYVSDALGFARFLTSVSNTGNSVRTYILTITTNLGSDSSTQILSSSDGNSSINSADTWVITDDSSGGGDPTNLSIYSSIGAAVQPIVSRSGDILNHSYTLTLSPGQTKYVMQIASQGNNLEEQQQRAATLSSSELIFAGLSMEERTGLVNWSSVSPIFSTIGSATPIALNAIISDSITSYGSDWFVCTLRAGQTIDLGMSGFDTRLGLYDARNNLLAWDDDGYGSVFGISVNSHITYTVNAGGNYYVRAYGFSGYSGTYRLANTVSGGTNHVAGGNIYIEGMAVQGQTLIASQSLTDTDGMGSISYQWLADGSAIAGATGSTLTLEQAQVGKAISVRTS